MKYNVCCTKIYNGSVEVEAENYSEAIELARMLIDKDKVDWEFGEATADYAEEQ